MSLIDRMQADDWPASGLTGNDLWRLVMSRAQCGRGGADPDQWYPVSAPGAAARREAAHAITVCTGCVVRMHCLELSLRHWTVGQHGIWGGTLPDERVALRRELVARQAGDIGAPSLGGRAAS
ncbi:MAG TPA: WhiB family transcriptional regulator [Trebonia sp.]